MYSKHNPKMYTYYSISFEMRRKREKHHSKNRQAHIYTSKRGKPGAPTTLAILPLMTCLSTDVALIVALRTRPSSEEMRFETGTGSPFSSNCCRPKCGDATERLAGLSYLLRSDMNTYLHTRARPVRHGTNASLAIFRNTFGGVGLVTQQDHKRTQPTCEEAAHQFRSARTPGIDPSYT